MCGIRRFWRGWEEGNERNLKTNTEHSTFNIEHRTKTGVRLAGGRGARWLLVSEIMSFYEAICLLD